MIVIVGLGALGSHLALVLRNHKEGLHLIDFDRVDSHNTQAQFHGVRDIRLKKSESLKKNLFGLFGSKVLATPHRVEETNAETLLSSNEVVADCTDNYVARQLIQKVCTKLPVPCLHGALSGDGLFSRVVWDEHFTEADREDEEGGATCENGERLPFFSFVSSFMGGEIQHFLKTGQKRSFQLTSSSVLRLA